MSSQPAPGHGDLVLRYDRPDYGGARTETTVSRTEYASMSVVLLGAGDSSNLHRHVHSDVLWFVTAGRLRFVGEGDDLVGEIGPEDGIVIPRGFAYRYDVLPDVEGGVVEAYRFGAADVPLASSNDDRVNLEPLRPGQDPGLAGPGPLGADEAAPSPFPTPQVFSYPRPKVDKGKKVDVLALTDRGVFGFQVLRNGGETNMHSHPHFDGFWFVRRGNARFYTLGDGGDQVLAELGPNEGVLIPKGFPYWFEAIIAHDDDECEIMQMEVADVAISGKRAELNDDRIDYAPSKVRG